MTWEDRSARHDALPGNWGTLRREVLKRDGGTCQELDEHGRKCGAHANQVDHVRPGDDHSLGNLRSLCRVCHAIKSSAEGHAARWGTKSS